MINFAGGVGKAGANVIGFEIRIIRQNFVRRHATGEHLQHISDADAHAANTRPSGTLFRADSDTREEIIHSDSVSQLARRAPAEVGALFLFRRFLLRIADIFLGFGAQQEQEIAVFGVFR